MLGSITFVLSPVTFSIYQDAYGPSHEMTEALSVVRVEGQVLDGISHSLFRQCTAELGCFPVLQFILNC